MEGEGEKSAPAPPLSTPLLAIPSSHSLTAPPVGGSGLVPLQSDDETIAAQKAVEDRMKATNGDKTDATLVELVSKYEALKKANDEEQYFMGGYSELFMGYDGPNILFFGWVLVEQLTRVLILTFVKGIAATLLLSLFAILGLLVALWRRPFVDRKENIGLFRAKLIEVCSFLPIAIAAGVGSGPETVAALMAVAPVVLLVNQVSVGLSVLKAISDSIQAVSVACKGAKMGAVVLKRMSTTKILPNRGSETTVVVGKETTTTSTSSKTVTKTKVPRCEPLSCLQRALSPVSLQGNTSPCHLFVSCTALRRPLQRRRLQVRLTLQHKSQVRRTRSKIDDKPP